MLLKLFKKYIDKISYERIIFLGLFFGIAIGLFYKEIPQNIYKKYTLEQTYKRVTELQRTNNIKELYEYILPSEKSSYSLEEFQKDSLSSKKPINEEITVNNIFIDGNDGLIDRTYIACYSKECTGKNRYKNTIKKHYFFVNGKWYFSISNSDVLCTRTTPYPLREEFNRALSLINQRLPNSSDASIKDIIRGIKLIRNCTDIQYAESEEEISGAEGVFMLDRNSSTDHLRIVVSPKYQIKDDLLTATLLAHELTHAFIHSAGTEGNITCYENEAVAFTIEKSFLLTLNKEEYDSLFFRYINNTSPEVTSLLASFQAIANSPGNYFSDKAETYLRNSPFYQKGCGL